MCSPSLPQSSQDRLEPSVFVVFAEGTWHGAIHQTDHLLQQSASQHCENMDLQWQEEEAIVDLLKWQAEQDKFDDGMLHEEAKEDQRVMASAFCDILQVLFCVMHNMSQTMMGYYWEKTSNRYGPLTGGTTSTPGLAHRALRAPRSQGFQSTSTTGPPGESETTNTTRILTVVGISGEELLGQLHLVSCLSLVCFPKLNLYLCSLYFEKVNIRCCLCNDHKHLSPRMMNLWRWIFWFWSLLKTHHFCEIFGKLRRGKSPILFLVNMQILRLTL